VSDYKFVLNAVALFTGQTRYFSMSDRFVWHVT